MLTPEQIRQYEQDGYVVVSGIFTTGELDLLEREVDAIIERRQRQKAKLDATWRGDWKKDLPPTVILHTHDVQAYSAAWARAIVHERFTEAIADVIGPNVQLHHTKAFIKPPEKGSAFPMHQDYPYFPHARHTMGAAIIHLSDATEEMGCFSVYPGSHKLGPLPCATPDVLYLDPVQYPIERAKRLPAACGDVVLFNYLLIHGSDINRSSRARKTVLVQFRDPTDRPTADVHRSHAQGMMLRGIDPLEGRSTGTGTLDEAKPPKPPAAS
ncbi:MAG: phytanoyl-CoA dioxygenase family protein [Lentisphaerae bacterium]|nr:phytanoyl-CoA dioxygenase family protein [Lentisphaerota bacterium]